MFRKELVNLLLYSTTLQYLELLLPGKDTLQMSFQIINVYILILSMENEKQLQNWSYKVDTTLVVGTLNSSNLQY